MWALDIHELGPCRPVVRASSRVNYLNRIPFRASASVIQWSLLKMAPNPVRWVGRFFLFNLEWAAPCHMFAVEKTTSLMAQKYSTDELNYCTENQESQQGLRTGFWYRLPQKGRHTTTMHLYPRK